MKKSGIAILAILVVSVLVFLWMRKKDGSGFVSSDDPSNALFSAPTIYSTAPVVDSSQQPQGSGSFILHEDNWRQIEFVSRQNLSNLTSLVKEVSDFEKANRDPSGWKSTYTRKEYAVPINGLGLSFQGLVNSFKPGPQPEALFLTSGNFEAGVKGGFSLRIKDLGVIYGQRHEDKILELGFEHGSATSASPTMLAQLAAFCGQNQLVVVDWYRREIVDLNHLAPGGQRSAL